MHVHRQNVEIAESIGPCLNSDCVGCVKGLFGPREGLLRRFLPAPSLLHFNHVERTLVVVFRVVELRDTFLQALQCYLDSGKSIN